MRSSLGASAALVLTLAGCGGTSAPATTAGAPSTTLSPVEGTAAPARTVTTIDPVATQPADPSALFLSSGRGDDGSLEVAVWLGADPFADPGHRVVVGTDADESFPGVGDPEPHLDGHLELTASTATLYDAGAPVAAADELRELVSWGWSDGVLRVFFIGSVPAKAGTAWVIVEIDGEAVPGGVAGAPFGTACSYHDAGLGIAAGAASVPGPETPCLYPSG